MNNWGFLGEIVIERGTARDYEALAWFHYIAGRPATWAGVWRGVFAGRVVAVGVLSWPTLACAAREKHFHLRRCSEQARRAFVNGNLRTISRVIVHPQFRGIGLAGAIVGRLLDECTTRYVEALSAMGRVHPLFERAGMQRCGGGRVVYYLWENQGGNHERSQAVEGRQGVDSVRERGRAAAVD